MKKNILQFIVIFTALVILSGCNTSPVENIAVEIIFFESTTPGKNNSYPKYMSDLLQPLENACEKKTNYGFNPISLKRKDINQEWKIDYLTNKAGDASKVKFVKRQITDYFEEAKIDSVSIAAPNSNNSYATYIATHKGAKNIFIYSANDEVKHEGYTIYNSIDKIRSAMSEFACKNTMEKMIVVVAPKIIEPQTTTEENEKEKWISAGDKETENTDYHVVLLNAEKYMKDDKDHDYGHPEAYSMLIKACKIAIEENQGPDLAKHLVEACEHGEIVCKKLKPGHEGRWRLVLMALNENNSALLKQIYDEVKETRQELIDDLLNNKPHNDHHEKH